jgi:hypothetical protein
MTLQERIAHCRETIAPLRAKYVRSPETVTECSGCQTGWCEGCVPCGEALELAQDLPVMPSQQEKES